ncbi:hypothetical protein HMPREF9413_5923 [Paenibacillus sp. HGF7]|nr:hypothetical protein HMPREF9413_5923 [Paenibacillus sp. HGF7]
MAKRVKLQAGEDCGAFGFFCQGRSGCGRTGLLQLLEIRGAGAADAGWLTWPSELSCGRCFRIRMRVGRQDVPARCSSNCRREQTAMLPDSSAGDVRDLDTPVSFYSWPSGDPRSRRGRRRTVDVAKRAELQAGEDRGASGFFCRGRSGCVQTGLLRLLASWRSSESARQPADGGVAKRAELQVGEDHGASGFFCRDDRDADAPASLRSPEPTDGGVAKRADLQVTYTEVLPDLHAMKTLRGTIKATKKVRLMTNFIIFHSPVFLPQYFQFPAVSGRILLFPLMSYPSWLFRIDNS